MRKSIALRKKCISENLALVEATASLLRVRPIFHGPDRIENAENFTREDFFSDFSISENFTLALRESLDSEGPRGLGAIPIQ